MTKRTANEVLEEIRKIKGKEYVNPCRDDAIPINEGIVISASYYNHLLSLINLNAEVLHNNFLKTQSDYNMLKNELNLLREKKNILMKNITKNN